MHAHSYMHPSQLLTSDPTHSVTHPGLGGCSAGVRGVVGCGVVCCGLLDVGGVACCGLLDVGRLLGSCVGLLCVVCVSLGCVMRGAGERRPTSTYMHPYTGSRDYKILLSRARIAETKSIERT